MDHRRAIEVLQRRHAVCCCKLQARAASGARFFAGPLRALQPPRSRAQGSLQRAGSAKYMRRGTGNAC
jgi:hypothetical protein